MVLLGLPSLNHCASVYVVDQGEQDLCPSDVVLMSVFTTLLFKALAVGPGVSTVLPIIRVGSILSLRFSVCFFFAENITPNLTAGLVLAISGICLVRVVCGNP
jgi:hypothetical protein